MRKYKLYTILLVILIHGNAISQNNRSIEMDVINSILIDIYSVGYGEKVVQLPYIACRDFKTDTIIDNCKSIPKEYRIYCKNCVNIDEFDTLNLIMYVEDTLIDLDITDNKNYLISKLDENSEFIEFIKSAKKINKRYFTVDSLFQNQVKAIFSTDTNKYTKDTITNIEILFNSERPSRIYDGLNGNSYIIGLLIFSRIVFNETKDLGLLRYTFLCDPNCGYRKYVLIKLVNDKWKIVKIIDNGVF